MAKAQSQELALAAQSLTAAPSDLGAWLRVASALAAAGKRDEAARAFARLGKAASSLAQVALAVACARWLDQQKRADEAAELIDLIAETHCAGSKAIDWDARLAPPPPRKAPSERVPKLDLDQAAEVAAQAIDAAAEAAEARAPDKLPPTPLVRALSPDDFKVLVGVIEMRRRPADQIVVDVGQPARTLYWVARGALDVSRDGHHLGELTHGTFFGEIALVGGTTRTARVRCTEDTWLLEIPASSLEEIAGRAPKLAKVLAEYARARLLANVTRTSELFQRLEEKDRRALLARFSSRMFQAGDKLIEQGKTNDTLFVIVSGVVDVLDDTGAQVAELVPGDGVGEISLISGKPASADVIAREPVAALGLARKAFDEFAVAYPGLLAEVYKLKVDREQENADTIIHDAEDLIV